MPDSFMLQTNSRSGNHSNLAGFPRRPAHIGVCITDGENEHVANCF